MGKRMRVRGYFWAFFCVVSICILMSCSGCETSLSSVAKPQRGGEASMDLSPSSPAVVVKQPENSQSETVATYEREVVPIESLVSTNWLKVRERYTTSLGTHQKDEARSGFAAVQKTAAVLRSQSPIMYAGLLLIVASLAMSYFQAKFPAVFSPGLKLIALTFLTGLCLLVLPSLTQDKTVLTMSLFAGAGMVVFFVLAKNFSSEKSDKSDKNNTSE